MLRKLATAAALAALTLFTRVPLAGAQKALVYCPVGVDATGCDRIVGALSAKFTEGVDRGYDGSAGTIDLEKADLHHYSVFVVPSLADDGDKQPYAVLRKAASHLHYAINGRVAVYSGAPDQGNSNRADKDALIQNLTSWASDGHTRKTGLVGMVAFLDLSEDESARYSWVHQVSLVDVSADTEDQSIGEATPVGTRGGDLLKVGGRALNFSNMASNGLHIGNRGAARTEIGAIGGTTTHQSVLVTYSNADGAGDKATKVGTSGGASYNLSAGKASLDVAGSANATSGATLTTDKPDYLPGDTVTFTGTGFAAGDTVTITVHEDPTWSYPDRQFASVADANGGFVNRQMVVDKQDLGATFTTTAVGNPSGVVAQTTFTDGNAGSVTGTVTDASTTTALAGVGVSCTAGCNAAGSTTTDASGNYSFTGATKLSFQGNGPATLTLTFSKIGYASTTLTFTIQSNGDSRGPDHIALTPTQVAPSFSFSLSTLSAKTYGDAPFSVSSFVSTNSNGTISFALGTGSVGCSVTPAGQVSITAAAVGANKCIIAASVSATSSFLAAGPANQSFNIAQAGLTVTANNSSKTYGDAVTFTGTEFTPVGLVNSETIGSVTLTSAGAATTATVAGSPYTIVPTAATGGTFTASNYAITYANGSLTVNKKVASVAAVASTKTYGDPDPALTTTNSGFVAGDLGTSKITFAASRAAGETVLGGPYTITPAASDNGTHLLDNYTVTPTTAAFTITTKAASVTPNLANKTYGDADPSFGGTLAGFLAADAVAASYARTAGETVAGGPYTISATLTPVGALSNYTITYNTASFTINKRAASVTPNAASKVYGAADPTLTGTLTSFVTADGVTATYTRAAGETVLGGPYAISATLSPAAVLLNYTITYNTANFTITPKTASVTPNTASKTYGDADPSLSGTLTGFLAGDNVLASYSRTAGETVAGGPYTISATLTPAAVLSNYSITSNTASFTINKRHASVTPAAASKVYGAADPTLTGTLSSFVGADGVTATYTRAAGETVLGGPYAITATLSPAAVLVNYDVAYNTANFTITAKTTSVTPNAASKTYGDADPALGGTLSGFIPADGVTATYARTAGETVAGGPYTISATLSPAGVLSNYSITSNTASFTISKRIASVTPNAASKVYGAADPALTGTLTNFITADGVTAAYSRAAGETVLGGPYTISATLSPAAALGNYTVTYNTANFTITAKVASVTPNVAGKTYGDADPTFTGTLSGFLAADNVTATYGRTAGETVAGSPYTVSATLSPAGVLSNYSITSNTAAFNITKRAATVTPGSPTKVYGSPDPALSGTLTGFLAGDNVTATYSRAAGETVLGGPYAITATLAPTGVLGNYDVTYNPGSLTITPKAASVTPANNEKIYGGSDPALTGTLYGFLSADGVTATYSRAPGETVAGSPYTINATLTPAGVLTNYNITYHTGVFTIKKKVASVTPNAASKTYGDADPTFSGTLSGFLAADGVAATYARTTGETVLGGPYTISATLTPAGVLANYDITSNTASFTINAKTASVTPNPSSKTYGSADPVFTGTLTGFLTADNVTATYSRTAGETVAGSPYTISATLSPAGVLSNYSIASNTASFTINKKTASVTPDAKSKTYGDADPSLTGALVGFLPADVVTASYSRTPGETVLGGPYTISASLSPAAVLGNYDITSSTASFTINTKSASVTPDAKTKVYGYADPTLTGTLNGFLAADNVTATYNRTSGENVAGGPYTISAMLAPAAVLSNYSITSNSANFTITKRPSTVSAVAASKTYGDPDPALTTTNSGFVAGDLGAGKITFSATRVAGETVMGSPYAITPAASDNGTSLLNNYTVTLNPAGFAIGRKSASVTPNAASKAYGDADPAFTGNLSGFIAADGVSASYTRSPSGDAPTTNNANPVSYTISASLAPAGVLGNYNITYATPTFTITNDNPIITSLLGPAAPVPLNQPVVVTGTFSDHGVSGDAYTISSTWTSAGSPLTVSGNAGSYNGNSGSFTITAPSNIGVGVYSVTVTVTDRWQAASAPMTVTGYVVVYDVNGGFVTGGGWINSPAGACSLTTLCSGATGKANFGFVSKYQKGQSIPSGDTQFQFQAGGIDFHSMAYDWLVIAGARAQYKGTGTINGKGHYGFMLTAIDGGSPGGGGTDRFRIKIWDIDNGGLTVYDNQVNTTDDAGLTTPGTLLGGGSIQIHN